MAAASGSRLGFFTPLSLHNAWVGGLLVTNHLGRPLEFQCTNPVRPNRMQEILYGATLEPFLLTELIGRTLIERIGVRPELILVSDEAHLTLREHVGSPVAQVVERRSEHRLGSSSLRFHPGYANDAEILETLRKSVGDGVDLTEPFARIREALTETLGAATVAEAA